MGKTKREREDVLVAIAGSHGVKRVIVDKLNISRQTLDNYLDRWSTVMDAYLEEKSYVDDEAYSVVVDDIVKNRSIDTAKWWLVRKVDEFKDDRPKGDSKDPIVVKVIHDRD